MKLAISGKGGVGKTTLSAMLAATLAMKGRKVIAVDADPDANLASALGLTGERGVTPLVEMTELIQQRTGAKGNYGAFFKLNPKVDDIPETYARRIDGIRLLVLGGIQKGGAGCACPASALLKALLVHLTMGRDDALVMDMEAGIEHLGRSTGAGMDAMIVVVDTSPWSIQTALRVRQLAGQIGMKNIFAVANRLASPAELDAVRQRLGEIPLLGHLPTDPRLAKGIVSITGGQLRPGAGLAENLSAVEKILSQLQERL